MRENLHRPLANIRTLCGLLLVAVLGNTSISIMASTVVSLTHGPLVGAVKPMQAKIWLRTSVSATVQVEYSTSADFLDSLSSSEAMTTQQKDWTAIIQLSELIPETMYFYRLLVNESILPSVYQLKTSPPTSAKRSFSFVVFSDFRDSVAPSYRSVAEDNPAFVVFLGDFSHREPSTLAEMRDMHRTLRGPETPAGRDFISYIRKFPFYHVWDDHDLGKNDADKTFHGKEDALRAFPEYFPTQHYQVLMESGTSFVMLKQRYSCLILDRSEIQIVSQIAPVNLSLGLSKRHG